jgi:hypothetical protein
MSAPASLPTEQDALNQHGVFLKKRVLDEISSIPGMGVFAEEFGVAFDVSTAIDILARDKRKDPNLLFVLECKRAYVREKKWLFFRDINRKFRIARFVSTVAGQFGRYVGEVPGIADCHVCSDGYEIVTSLNDCKASPEPIYQAANQLCRGYLGFVKLRIDQRDAARQPNEVDSIVPVLVTTAEIHVAQFDVADISLTTGNLDSRLKKVRVDWLVLKHPFAVPLVSRAVDFRHQPSANPEDAENWNQQFRESIFVVRADKLKSFFSQSFRSHLYGLK